MSHSPVSEPRQTSSTQKIGWFTASCLLVSNIIGGGIFTTTGFMARDLGDPMLILLLWFVGALFALGGAMVYGELGAALPHAGGDYVYLREAYGPLVAFLSGWTSFTIGFGAALAASAVSFASYALRVIPLTDESGWLARGLALSLLWAVTLVHCGGLGTGGRMQRLLTTTKILAICGFILGGLLYGSGQWAHLTAPAPESHPSLGAAAIALLFVMYSYLGWNVVSYIAGEITDPQRSLPRIMVGGTASVAVLYLLLNVVYLYALPIASLAQEPLLPVAEKAAAALWGPGSAQFVAALLCLAIAGAVSAMVWAGPRVYWAMAHDGVISPWLARLHAAERRAGTRDPAPKRLGLPAHSQRDVRATDRLQRPRTRPFHGTDPLHHLSLPPRSSRRPASLPSPALSVLACHLDHGIPCARNLWPAPAAG